MSGASERANGRASDPVLTSRFLFVPDHSATAAAVNSLTGRRGCPGKGGVVVVVDAADVKIDDFRDQSGNDDDDGAADLKNGSVTRGEGGRGEEENTPSVMRMTDAGVYLGEST